MRYTTALLSVIHIRKIARSGENEGNFFEMPPAKGKRNRLKKEVHASKGAAVKIAGSKSSLTLIQYPMKTSGKVPTGWKELPGT
jgi:hypothetical protein